MLKLPLDELKVLLDDLGIDLQDEGVVGGLVEIDIDNITYRGSMFLIVVDPYNYAGFSNVYLFADNFECIGLGTVNRVNIYDVFLRCDFRGKNFSNRIALFYWWLTLKGYQELEMSSIKSLLCPKYKLPETLSKRGEDLRYVLELLCLLDSYVFMNKSLRSLSNAFDSTRKLIDELEEDLMNKVIDIKKILT